MTFLHNREAVVFTTLVVAKLCSVVDLSFYFLHPKAGELMIQPNVTTYSPPSTVVLDTVEIIGLGSAVTDVMVDGLQLGSSQIVFIDGVSSLF